MRVNGDVPVSIVAAERWRQVGRELRAMAPEVYLAALLAMELMVAQATSDDASIDESSILT